jgi:Tfp pilus assembly protein PilN
MKVNINLLPPSRKEEIRGKKQIGLVLRIGFMAIFSVVVFVIFLFFSLKVVKIQKGASESIVTELGRSEIYKDVYDVENLIEKNYQRANQLSKELNQQNYYWEVFDQLNQIISDGIFLDELTIKDSVVTMRGFVQTREELVKFKEGLEQNEKFKKVDAPISNFTLNENINFEFILEAN